jgi:hypothetical protein
MIRMIALGVATVLTFAATPAETYTSAAIDANGRLVIHTSARRTIAIPRTRDQTTFADPVVSSDGLAVGAQAEFPNCCTSYDIPLELVVYSKGKVHRFRGVGLPIFDWQFAGGGARVAYDQQTVHFACSIHYELRDVASERLLDSADVPELCGQNQNPDLNVRMPDWVVQLRSRKHERPAQ